MREYFESEMRLLHEAAVDFAKAHPDQARMLNLTEVRDRDPYVERLLEGMAFIAAQIRGRIDDSEVAITEQLLEQLCPGLLRGYPSGSILEITPEAHAQSGKHLPAGSRVSSAPVGEPRQACHFTTTSHLDVLPLTVSALKAPERLDGTTELDIEVAHTGTGTLEELGVAHLEFYLHADQALALSLFQGMTEGPGTVRLYVDDDTEPFAQLPGSALTAPYIHRPMDAAGALHRSQPGFDLLQDYFAWRERFLFVRLDGLGDVVWPQQSQRLRIVVPMQVRLPAQYQLKAEQLRLNCVPAINLYTLEADPIEVDQRRAEYRFLPDKRRPDTVVLHQVHELIGREHRSSRTYRYVPFYQARAREEGEHCYRINRRELGLATPQPFLSLSGPDLVEPQTVSARVSVSDGYLPRRYLSENQIKEPGQGIPSALQVRNIVRPSSYLPCPDSNAYRWQLQALMQLPVAGLATLEGLESLLDALDWTGREDNRRRRQAVQKVTAEPVTRMLRGMLYRGLSVQLHLDEGDFLSLADIYLFGCVLHRLLSMAAPINESIELSIIAQPSQREFRWEPQAGCAAPM